MACRWRGNHNAGVDWRIAHRSRAPALGLKLVDTPAAFGEHGRCRFHRSANDALGRVIGGVSDRIEARNGGRSTETGGWCGWKAGRERGGTLVDQGVNAGGNSGCVGHAAEH